MTPGGGSGRTVRTDRAVRAGRLTKARQFLQVADDARALAEPGEVQDAAVTLYVHAGIAAADAICAAALGEHAQGQDHRHAVALLATVDQSAASQLSTLLGMKTRAGYGHDPMTETAVTRAARAARALVERALL